MIFLSGINSCASGWEAFAPPAYCTAPELGLAEFPLDARLRVKLHIVPEDRKPDTRRCERGRPPIEWLPEHWMVGSTTGCSTKPS